MTKVLYIIGGNGKRYGSEIIAMDLIHYIKNLYDIEFTVITAKNGVINEFCQNEGVENFVIPFREYVYASANLKVFDWFKRKMRLLQAEIADRIAIKRIEGKIRIEEFEIIHTNISRNLLGARLGKKYQIPHLWHLQENSEEHYHLSLIMDNQIDWMNDNTQKFAAVSDFVKTAWKRKGLAEDKIDVIWNGIPISKYSLHNMQDDKDIIRIIMIGLLSESKGQMQLLEALSMMDKKEISHYKVDFYGGGDKKYILKMNRFIKNKNLLAYVNIKGYSSNLNHIISRYDIGINCSRAEAFGIVTIEYMASGICPIVSDKGSNPDFVTHMNNGLIYEYGNINSLKNCLLFLHSNKRKITEYGENAKKTVIKRFTVERMAYEFYESYNKLKKGSEGNG